MFDLEGLRAAVLEHGRVARVVIAAHDGSSPREVGAAMLVWRDGQSGTVGGGALEWEATVRARGMLADGVRRLDREALGPKLGQCCGGSVSLLTEVYGVAEVAQLNRLVVVRPTDTRAMPLAVKRIVDQARGSGINPAAQLLQGWMVEPVLRPLREIWIWGAGHVGRALVSVLAPLPGVQITWVDVAAERFPAVVPEGVRVLPVAEPALAVNLAPAGAEHLVLTFSHALDLEICHQLLWHGFARAGLIGSATKWARFRSRLGALGHPAAEVARIDCPIGDPALGKHPQAIAVGVAMQFLVRGALVSGAILAQEKAL